MFRSLLKKIFPELNISNEELVAAIIYSGYLESLNGYNSETILNRLAAECRWSKLPPELRDKLAEESLSGGFTGYMARKNKDCIIVTMTDPHPHGIISVAIYGAIDIKQALIHLSNGLSTTISTSEMINNRTIDYYMAYDFQRWTPAGTISTIDDGAEGGLLTLFNREYRYQIESILNTK